MNSYEAMLTRGERLHHSFSYMLNNLKHIETACTRFTSLNNFLSNLAAGRIETEGLLRALYEELRLKHVLTREEANIRVQVLDRLESAQGAYAPFYGRLMRNVEFGIEAAAFVPAEDTRVKMRRLEEELENEKKRHASTLESYKALKVEVDTQGAKDKQVDERRQTYKSRWSVEKHRREIAEAALTTLQQQFAHGTTSLNAVTSSALVSTPAITVASSRAPNGSGSQRQRSNTTSGPYTSNVHPAVQSFGTSNASQTNQIPQPLAAHQLVQGQTTLATSYNCNFQNHIIQPSFHLVRCHQRRGKASDYNNMTTTVPQFTKRY